MIGEIDLKGHSVSLMALGVGFKDTLTGRETAACFIQIRPGPLYIAYAAFLSAFLSAFHIAYILLIYHLYHLHVCVFIPIDRRHAKDDQYKRHQQPHSQKRPVRGLSVGVMMVVFRVRPTGSVVYMLPILVVLFLFTFGICNIFMHYGVYVNDLAYIVGIVLTMLMYLSASCTPARSATTASPDTHWTPPPAGPPWQS